MSLSYLFTAYAARIPMQVNNISKFSFGIRKMALDLGNLLGGVTNATTALSKETGVKAFLSTFRKYGA